MMLHHNFTLDLLQPGTPHRIPVKQGDTLTHSLDILLTANGEPWIFPADTTPVLRWHASDPGSGKYARGIYDTLPDGVHAWTTAENLLNIITVPQMFALPGLVRADVLLIQGEKTLATFNFEFYVNPAPVNGTEPEAQSFYKVASLDQINGAISVLEEWKAGADLLLAHLQDELSELKRIVLDS